MQDLFQRDGLAGRVARSKESKFVKTASLASSAYSFIREYKEANEADLRL